MPTITPSPITGATIKPGPMVTVVPERETTDAELAGLAPDSGLNAPYVADLLSAFVAHERDGVAMYSTLGAMTKNPLLQGKYATFRKETEQTVGVYESLIESIGGSPQYVSPPSRLTMQMDGKLLEAFQLAGSADELSLEMAGVQAVLAASALCLANAQIVVRLADEAAEGPAREALKGAVEPLLDGARRHLDWASETCQTMAVTQAKSRAAQTVGAAAEKAVGKVKDALH